MTIKCTVDYFDNDQKTRTAVVTIDREFPDAALRGVLAGIINYGEPKYRHVRRITNIQVDRHE